MSAETPQGRSASRKNSEQGESVHSTELTLPPWMEAYGKYISAEKWDNELSPTQPNIETSDLNTYAVRWMVEADRRGAVFGDFFELFQEDFEGWTLEMFNNMGKQVRAQFRKRFVYHGVWVSDHQSAGPVAARLHALLHQRYPPRWTQERIDEALDKGTSFHPAFQTSSCWET